MVFMKYFLSFVEEGIFNERYYSLNYVGGRLEVYSDDSQYAIDEIRFLTNKKSWYKFRDEWDFKDVTPEELEKIEKIIRSKYYKLLDEE